MLSTKRFRTDKILKSSIGLCAAFSILAGQLPLSAGEVYPEEGWVDDYNPIASPDAVVGGKLNVGFGAYPSSFNYYLDLSTQASTIISLLYDTLMFPNPVTLDLEPMICDKMEVSDDKKTFTLHFNPNAKWSDGMPITGHDFIFTYDTIMNPKHLVAGIFKAQFDEFEKPELIDDHTVRIRAKAVHWLNAITLGTTQVLPKHAFENLDFNEVKFDFPVVSGHYEIDELKEGVHLNLKRRDDWWLDGQKRYMGVDNFEIISLRFYMNQDMMFPAFNAREIDYHAINTSRIWKTETDGERFAKNWVIKQAVYNQSPMALSGLIMNMRIEQYKDVRVRKALAHLFARDRMNETLMYNAYIMLNSYDQSYYDTEHPNPNEPIDFNVEKARALLSEAGWVANSETGLLEKDGKTFVINLLMRSPVYEKFIAIYAESLKDVGIELNIIMKDWAAWSKDMDEKNFEMTWVGWRPSLFEVPDQLWHSQQADLAASSNYSGFKNEAVDALIEEMKGEFDAEKRRDITRQIDQIIYKEHPMVLAWVNDHKRLVYWNKFGTPDTVLDKYQDDDQILHYWYFDPDLESELETAMDSGESLPPRQYEIHFEEEFQGN